MLHDDLDMTTEQSLDDIGQSRQDPPPAGWYHVLCTEVKPTNNSSLRFEFRILAGTSPEWAGREFSDFLRHDPKVAWRKKIYAKAFKLINQADLGRQVRIDWEACINRQAVVKIVPNTYTDSKTGREVRTTQVGELYALDDPKAAGSPRAGGTQPTPNGNGANHHGAAANPAVFADL